MKQLANERYRQDESGQWWYHFGRKNPTRTRAEIAVCAYCGEKFLRSTMTRRNGEMSEHCSRSCGIRASKLRDPGLWSRERSGRWKGGRYINRRGYVMVLAPDHWTNEDTTRRYVQEHRLVMEQKLGRRLKRHERVHHKNGDRTDNRPENLELWAFGHPAGQRVAEKPHCPTCTCHEH